MSVPHGKTTFTLPEAAELLSCHRETLRRAIRNGELRAAKLGRGFRISRTDLEAFWTACGGGELFGPETETPAGQSAVKEADKTPKKKKDRKDRQVQFSLLGATPEAAAPVRAEDRSGEAGDTSGTRDGQSD